jgi:hypothetical protein
MSDFSLLVRLKYDALASQQKQIFDEAYKRRKKPFDEYHNSDLALEILKDISIMLPAIETKSVDNIAFKKSVNNHYIVKKK